MNTVVYSFVYNSAQGQQTGNFCVIYSCDYHPEENRPKEANTITTESLTSKQSALEVLIAVQLANKFLAFYRT